MIEPGNEDSNIAIPSGKICVLLHTGKNKVANTGIVVK